MIETVQTYHQWFDSEVKRRVAEYGCSIDEASYGITPGDWWKLHVRAAIVQGARLPHAVCRSIADNGGGWSLTQIAKHYPGQVPTDVDLRTGRKVQGDGRRKVRRVSLAARLKRCKTTAERINVRYAYAKESHNGALLMFRMGDFWEMFYQDAEVASRTLGLTLTTRSRFDEEKIPMSGFPYHQLDTYVQKLKSSGVDVACVEFA